MKTLILFISFFFLTVSQAQDVGFVWANQLRGANWVQQDCNGIAVDNSGNVFVVGRITDSVDFDPSVNDYWIHSDTQFESPAYVAKYDPNGNFIWAKKLSSLDLCIARNIKIDNNNDLYILGDFRDSVDFDPGTSEYWVEPINGIDAFLLKLDADGNFTWVKTWGGPSINYGYELTLDHLQNIYIAGTFRDSIDIDPGPNLLKIGSNGEEDVYIQKFDSNGDLIWFYQIGGNDEDRVFDLSTDNQQNLYIAGSFQDSVDFNLGMNDSVLYNLGSTSGYLLKLNSIGEFIWVRENGGPHFQEMVAVETCKNGEVCIVGSLYGSGQFISNNDTVVGPWCGNGTNQMLIKLDSNANIIWSRIIGGVNSGVYDGELSTDSLDNVYCASSVGEFAGFNMPNPVYIFSASGAVDLMVYKYTSDGFYSWSEHIGGTNASTWHEALDIDPTGNLHITGRFNFTVDFDPTPGNFDLTQYGSSMDAFFLKLNQSSLMNFARKDAKSEPILFPNPAKTELNIQFLEEETYPVIIYDLQGRIIQLDYQNFNKINVSNFDNGIYFLVIDRGNQRIVKRFIVQH